MAKPKLPWVKMVCYLPFALINVAFGLFFIWMPFLFPIGIVFLILPAMPYVKWLSDKIKADIEYAERDHTLNEGEELPWESEDGTISEGEIMDIIINRTGRGSQS